MIAIDDLHKSYRTADGRLSAVLKGLSLQVPERSITAVVGPSGAGKSTLARCISLLEQPDSGSIRINGQDLSALSGEALRRERRAIGTVFQSSALLSRRTAWENVALPLAWLGVVERDIKARVGELLESVGLSHKADAWPAQLSGGQRQRIGMLPPASRAPGASGSALPARWRCARPFCWRMKPPPASILRPRPRCWLCSSGCVTSTSWRSS